MELQQLRNFIAVAESRNISQAARALLISQPALSRSIHALEEDVGAALFIRKSGGLELTSQGVRMLAYARETLAAEELLRRELQDPETAAQTICLLCRSMEKFLTDVLTQYAAAHPATRFCILQNDDIALQNHQYDLIVSGGIPDEAGHVRRRLFTERILCALPTGHPLAEKGSITKEEFTALAQIQFGGHRQVRRLMQEKLEQYGLHPKAQTVCDDVRTACALVSAGFGTVLIPEFALDEALEQRVCLCSIEGVNISRDVFLYHRRNVRLPDYVESFAAFLLQYFRKQEA